jgi:hypothetical protein
MSYPIFAIGTPINDRRIQDTGLSAAITLPNAASTTVNSNWIPLFAAPWSNYYTQNQAGLATPPAGTANSPNGPYVASERIILGANVTASANANGGNLAGNCLIYLQHCPALSNGNYDSGNITNIALRSAFRSGNVPWLGAYNTAGSGGNTAADTIYDSLPPNVLSYIRLSAVTGANTGNMADATANLNILF